MSDGMHGFPRSHATTMIMLPTSMPADWQAAAISNMQLGSTLGAEQQMQTATMMQRQGMTIHAVLCSNESQELLS